MKPFSISVGISVRSHIELPYYAKYLLLASYLASCNPAHTDRRFFTKQGRRGLSNRAKAAAKAKKSNTQLTGGKIKINCGIVVKQRYHRKTNLVQFWASLCHENVALRDMERATTEQVDRIQFCALSLSRNATLSGEGQNWTNVKGANCRQFTIALNLKTFKSGRREKSPVTSCYRNGREFQL